MLKFSASLMTLILLGAISSWIGLSASASRAPAAHSAVTDIDLTPLINFLERSIYSVDQPFRVYHWFGADREGVFTQAEGLAYARTHAQLYINNLGLPVREGKYGPGLYAAIDPVVSERVKPENGWGLLAITIPRGFRLLRILESDLTDLPRDVQGVLTAIGCGQRGQAPESLERLLDPRSLGLAPKCNDTIARVLRDLVRVDGFLYSYEAAYFAACAGDQLGARNEQNAALVLISDRTLSADQVQLFTAGSRTDVDERGRIEALFSKTVRDVIQAPGAAHDFGFAPWRLEQRLLAQSYPNEDWKMDSATDCRGGVCQWRVTLCAHDASATCRSQAAPVLTGRNDPPHWSDLKAPESDANLEEWMHQNLLGCAPENHPFYRKP